MKVLVLKNVIVAENSILIKLHQFQDTLNFITNEEKLDFIILSEKTAIVLFLDQTLEIDIILEIIFLLTDLRQDHVHDLPPHLQDLVVMYNQSPLKIITTLMKTFQSR